MAAAKTRPDRSCLQTLLAGELAPSEQEPVIRHVETCASCQRVLDSLTPASRSWEDVAAHLRQEVQTPAPPVLQQVMERAKAAPDADKTETDDQSTPHGNAPPGDETQAEARTAPRDYDLAYLHPPTKPGALGRLGHYEVLEVIGKGGFGTVLKAFDAKLHRMVAIKVLSPGLAANGTARERFIREARAAAAVTHEHLVTIHAVDEDHRPPYLVMQLIDGVTLQQKLDKSGALGVKGILRVGMQMAAGLAAAHKQGLVHRDIKPANVLLENGVERVKITDFGLAKIADDASVSQSGVVAGTPMYMSPEQADGEQIDHRSDLFSLGTVLYVMCTGHAPFRAGGTLAVLKRVIDASPRPICDINNEIPDWLEAIVAKLHAKKPEDRFQTAKEVAELLGQHLARVQQPDVATPAADASKAISLERTTSREATAKPVPTRRRLFVGAGAVGILTVVAISLGIYFQGRLGSPPIAPSLAVAPFDFVKAKEYQDAWAKHLGIEVETSNSIGMKLRLIPPGEFMMGTSQEQIAKLKSEVLESKGDHWLDIIQMEGPVHRVRLTQPYYMGVHEVTQVQFRQFVEAEAYQTEAERSGKGGFVPDGVGGNKLDLKAFWRNPCNYDVKDDFPVLQVSWNDAQEFCLWLSKKEGRTYRLATEAEWEFACRAGSSGLFSFGDDPFERTKHAVSQQAAPMAAGSKTPNPFGLFDMEGNAWEFCADWFGPYSGTAETNPEGMPNGTTRAMRGGSYMHRSWASRPAMRGAVPPSESHACNGFRVVLVGNLKSKTPPLAVAPFGAANAKQH